MIDILEIIISEIVLSNVFYYSILCFYFLSAVIKATKNNFQNGKKFCRNNGHFDVNFRENDVVIKD
jgi:hypothetical protein